MKWRALLILERLLATTTSSILHTITSPPSLENAFKGHSTCEISLEEKLAATPLAHMENSTP
jgi:hypothetical protein